MNCLIKKKGHYKTVKDVKIYTFHMNIFLILLIYHLSSLFGFPGAYSRKYTVLIKTLF